MRQGLSFEDIIALQETFDFFHSRLVIHVMWLLYRQNKLNEFNLYLYGLVLKDQERKKEARDIFINVLNKFPCFWSCWLELCRLIDGEDLVKF